MKHVKNFKELNELSYYENVGREFVDEFMEKDAIFTDYVDSLKDEIDYMYETDFTRILDKDYRTKSLDNDMKEKLYKYMVSNILKKTLKKL